MSDAHGLFSMCWSGVQAVPVQHLRLGFIQVYASFEDHLHRHELRFVFDPVEPLTGFPGAPMGNKAAVYEGGFRLYHIDHAASPCASRPAAAKAAQR
jgi:hypothetical protein